MAGILGAVSGVGAAVGGVKAVKNAATGIINAANNLFGSGNGPTFAQPIAIKLSLGDFVFQEMEIPENIPYHASQRLSIKKHIGGKRTIDALGEDFEPITWSGHIFPTATLSAVDRAKQLEKLRKAALPLLLTWDSLRFQVMISDFRPDYRFQRIPYTISLEVLDDLRQPASAIVNPSVDDLVSNGLDALDSLMATLGAIVGLSNAIINGIAALSSLIGNVKVAVYAVSSSSSSASSASPAWSQSKGTASTGLVSTSSTASTGTAPSSLDGAPSSVVNPIMQTVVAALNQAAALISSVDSLMAGASGVGGVVPGANNAANVSAITAFIGANQAIVALLQVESTLNVMLSNLQEINSSVKIITVSGGNLYQVAALEYGDSLAADLIMEANGLLDPQLSGNVTLIIPPYNAAAVNGGILSV